MQLLQTSSDLRLEARPAGNTTVTFWVLNGPVFGLGSGPSLHREFVICMVSTMMETSVSEPSTT